MGDNYCHGTRGMCSISLVRIAYIIVPMHTHSIKKVDIFNQVIQTIYTETIRQTSISGLMIWVLKSFRDSVFRSELWYKYLGHAMASWGQDLQSSW